MAERNVFSRIIGRRSALPLERPCAELLASLLATSRIARDALLRAFAKAMPIALPAEPPGSRWTIRTEASVGAKRDDLRLELFGPDGAPLLLWTIEVKVAAGIHSSSVLEMPEVDTAAVVPQLQNYDRWLMSQTAPCRAGVVIARERIDLAPFKLEAPWTNTTWARLGKVLEPLLDTDLPADERFLIAQSAGFIAEHLTVAEDDMADGRLGLEHLALVRGVAQFAEETKQRTDALVEGLQPLLERPALQLGSVETELGLFTDGRSIVKAHLFGDGAGVGAFLGAGIVTERGDSIAVWIETSDDQPRKAALLDALRTKLVALNARAEARGVSWVVNRPEEKLWWDVELRVPLEQLLGASDQAGFVREIVDKALGDVEACDIVGVFDRTLRVETGPTR